MSTNPVVLDEDTYTEAISYIIERDFFPNLAKLKARQNYFQAQESGSLVSLQQAGKALSDLSQTPLQRTAGAPESLPQNFYNQDEPELATRVNLNLSLDQFQTLYTSEDNASFTDLLEKANAKRKDKYKLIFDETANRLLIEGVPNNGASLKRVKADEAPPGTWKYMPRNALMYFADGTGGTLLNEADSRAPPRAIAHGNTQLEIEEEKEKSETSLKPSDIAAQQGKMTPWKEINGLDNSHTPEFRGFSLVDATPSPTPSRMGTPIMTWGSIEGTPVLIKGSETPGPQFSLPKASRREALGMRLSERASRAYRKKTKERANAVRGTPRSGAGLMSPAAQHLMRTHTPYSLGGFDAALRSSYGSPSATPNRRPGATPTPLFRAGATPGTATFKTPFGDTPVKKS
ncbi:nuclear protein DGCR14 [Phycomyces blakesleeanus]|uniref:Nuclear protein DGCR14 n=1 Tax=Phycomyces blakesleeanus TaxID=4837 RepID=A0ABR3BIS4_PHYBL